MGSHKLSCCLLPRSTPAMKVCPTLALRETPRPPYVYCAHTVSQAATCKQWIPAPLDVSLPLSGLLLSLVQSRVVGLRTPVYFDTTLSTPPYNTSTTPPSSNLVSPSNMLHRQTTSNVSYCRRLRAFRDIWESQVPVNWLQRRSGLAAIAMVWHSPQSHLTKPVFVSRREGR